MGKRKQGSDRVPKSGTSGKPFFSGVVSRNVPAGTVQLQPTGATPAQTPVPSATTEGIRAQKKLWDDIHAYFPDDARKLAGTGYRANGSPVTADFTEGLSGDVQHSAPALYVSKVFLDETDVNIRKNWISQELKKIDAWRVKTGRIDDLDITSTEVNTLIDKEPVPEKMKILGEMAKRTAIVNAKMIEHIRRKMPSTPWIAGAVAASNGGFTFQFENIKIVVNPDVFNSSQVSGGAETKIEPVGNPNYNSPQYGWGGDQKINRIAFTPTTPQVEYHITTHYSATSDPTHTSGYGVGTRSTDTGDQTKLRFHEGMHGRVFIEHIKNNIAANKYPEWKGEMGQTKTVFEGHKSDFETGVRAFSDMIKQAMHETVQQVDCVGKTIVQFHQQQGTTTTVTC